MKCRFCNREFRKLAKAHIIPRSFFKAVRSNSKYSILIQASKKEIKKEFKQAGIFDTSILCIECEARFKSFDDHGYRVFTNVFKKPSVYLDSSGNPCALLLPKVRYDLLKLFVLSLVWRASVSSLPFFSHVSLGPHEARIRNLIEARDPGDNKKYSFFCIHPWDAPFPTIIFPPVRRKIGKLNCTQVNLPNLYIVFKADNRPFHEPFSTLVIRPQPPHYLALLPYSGSREDKFMQGLRNVVRQHQRG